ncbi:iron complex transport system permease protein [Stackebrandtia albiflava]|uniref:Iron complex transport system permease protein n=1 Tax=Stackebrandtia albiflava TaxID=406432 RepID=A0A562UQ68_9ACTN|nr:iron ABC transporter permease [Stackebrandtia albiflava]TWJ07759.1 iron complex transport system permease protein [Stackebrandtia albiflava]
MTTPPRTRRLDRPGAVTTATVVLTVALCGSAILAIGSGGAELAPLDTARYLFAGITGGRITPDEITDYQIIWQIRTPRVLLAAVVGAGLAVTGVAVQALVRNALADPYVLGISSGAASGAATVTVLGGLPMLAGHGPTVGGFAGAMFAGALVYLLARSGGGLTSLRLVLVGVVLSFGFQAVMSVVVYLMPSGESTATVLFWLMGGFGGAVWTELPAVAAIVVAGIAVLAANHRRLDVLSLGDEAAAGLGVDAGRLRNLVFALTAVMTGAMVAVSGAIGFAGLILPHLIRMVFGASHGRVLTVAPVVGALFMVWVDLAARTWFAPRELPLGVITALVGVPVFIALLRRRAYLFGGHR